MTFADSIRWLASAGVLGVVSSYIVVAIKAFFPEVQDKVSVIVSIATAAVLAILANLALPHLAQIPPQIEQFWPIVVWAVQQAWYQFVVKQHNTEC